MSLEALKDWLFYPVPIAVVVLSILLVIYVFNNLFNQMNTRFDKDVTSYQNRIKDLEKMLDSLLNKKMGGN